MRQQLADQRTVVARGQLGVRLPVDAAQQRGLGYAEGGVVPLALEIEVDAVEAEGLAEPLPQQLGRASGRRHRDQVHLLRRQLLAPAVEDLGDLLHPPEPRTDPGGPLGVADLVEEGAVAQLGAVLDVLLPLRGDLADQVAHAQHEVDLGAVAVSPSMTERLERPADLRPRGGREDLVADDRGVLVFTHLAGEIVPGADRVRLQSAPRQLHQVERGEEVAVVPGGRVGDAGGRQHLAVAEQHVLEVRRAGLRRTDVEEDLAAHRPSSSSSSIARPRTEPGGRSDQLGSSPSGSPTTG